MESFKMNIIIKICINCYSLSPNDIAGFCHSVTLALAFVTHDIFLLKNILELTIEEVQNGWRVVPFLEKVKIAGGAFFRFLS